jgi:hypothetical protein
MGQFAAIHPECQFDPATESVVREEIAQILDHSSFRQSERCSKLLRYLVEISLVQDAVPLKERTIGNEVFGRPISYDTYSDPVVRNAASEIRKRLRQYHYESHVARKVRVELPNGRYLLNFEFVEPESKDPQGLLPHEAEAVINSMVEARGAEPRIPAMELMAEKENADIPKVRSKWMIALTSAAAMMVMAAMLFAAYRVGYLEKRAPNAFWAPIFANNARIVVSLGINKAEEAEHPGRHLLSFASVSAYGKVTSLLDSRERDFVMKPDASTSLDDLRNSTAILVGRPTNLWTSRLTSKLRFQAVIDPKSDVAYYVDTFHPETRWALPTGWETSPVDYGMVARIVSPMTGGTVIILSGLGAHGTAGAAEFVTQTRYRDLLSKTLGNSSQNVQMIVRVPVIGDCIGSPELVSSYTW